MAYAEGTGRFLGYNRESTWGTPIGAYYPKIRSLVGASVTTERSQLMTQELNSERAVTGLRLGTRKARVSIPYELFYTGGEYTGSAYAGAAAAQFDDFMESWMCGAWAAAGSAQTSSGAVTFGTVGATTAITVAATISGDIGAAIVGGWIKISGCSTAANNGYYKVTAYTSSASFTIATPNATALGITAGSQGASVSFTPVAYVVPSTTTKSLSFLESQTDIASSVILAKLELGAMANNFSLNIAPDAIITGAFEFLGKTFATGASYAAAAASAAALAGVTVTTPATFTAAGTLTPMTANDTLMMLMQDNVQVGVVTNLTINGSNGLEDMFPVGSLTPYAIGKGDSSVSGTMDVYLTDATYWASYQDETAFGLSAMLMDPANGTLTTRSAGKGYAIDIPNIKITGLTESKDKTKVIQSVSWTAIKNASASTKGRATASMVVSRLV